MRKDHELRGAHACAMSPPQRLEKQRPPWLGIRFLLQPLARFALHTQSEAPRASGHQNPSLPFEGNDL